MSIKSNNSINLSLERGDPEAFLLPNGVYVRMGAAFTEEELASQPGHELAYRVLNTFAVAPLPPSETEEGVILGPMMHYGLSPVTGRNINSDIQRNCLAVAAVGLTKDETRQAGLYSHVSTAVSYPIHGLTFRNDLGSRVDEFLNATKDGTRSLLIAGGAVLLGTPSQAAYSSGQYVNTVEMLGELTRPIANPVCLRPSMGHVPKRISLETQERTVHIVEGNGGFSLPEEYLPVTFQVSQARAAIGKALSCFNWE